MNTTILLFNIRYISNFHQLASFNRFADPTEEEDLGRGGFEFEREGLYLDRSQVE